MTAELLTERQSAEVAGVSLDTIRQYREFGLLRSTVREGAEYYRWEDLQSVFMLQENSSPEPQEETHQPSEVPSFGGVQELNETPIFNETQAHLTPSLGEVAPPKETELKESAPLPSDFENDTTTNVAAQPSESEVANPAVKNTAAQVPATRNSTEEIDSSLHLPAIRSAELAAVNHSLQQQIELLKEERMWLRERLEKLELRYEREQMLLLSENDTVRSLISHLHKPKRGFFASIASLPWFKR